MYRSCCVTAAANAAFRACPACGAALWRCPARGCGGLADEWNHCAACVWPVAAVNLAGAMRAGQRGAVEMRVWGKGRAPFEIETIRYRFASDEAWRERDAPLAVAPGGEERLLLDGFEPRAGGDYVLAVELRVRAGADLFHFAVESLLERVRDEQRQIHVHGDIVASGAALVTIENKDYGALCADLTLPAHGWWQVPPVRRDPAADRRANADDAGHVVTRATRVTMPHVETGEHASYSFHRGRLVFGRNRPEHDPAVDVLLRAHAPGDDRRRDLTAAISRRHFALFPRAGRLWIENLSARGSSAGGRAMPPRGVREVRHGDLLSPFTAPEDMMACSWKARFFPEGGRVATVQLQPAW